MKKIFTIAFICLALFIFTIILGETLEANYMRDVLMVRIGGIFFILFFVFLFWALTLSAKKKRNKVIGSVVTGFAVILSVIALLDVVNVYQDKSVYESGEYEVIQGVPKEASFNKDRHSKHDHLTSFEIDHIEFDLLPINMTKEDFEEQYQDKEVIVEYLPYSKMVLQMNRVE